jgi:hypothetical protein
MSDAPTLYPAANHDTHVQKNDDEISLYDISVYIIYPAQWLR